MFLKQILKLLMPDFTFYLGGGGGSSTPSSMQTTTGVLAPYAATTGQNLLGMAAGLVGVPSTQPQTDANGNFVPSTTGLTQYQPYTGSNLPGGQAYASGQVAPFTNLQNEAYNAAGNMRVAPQMSTGSTMAALSGQGDLSTANKALGYGQVGAGFGALGAMQGLSYGQNATNPYAVQQYMNPYLQASLAPQMQLLQQQQGQQQAANQAQATQAGAFGGSRMGVQNALQNQANQLAMSNLIGQGYSQAFNTANQNMQAAANLGMQGTAQGIQGAQAGLQGVGGAQAGYGGANTAAANLANIGNQQYQQQTGITNLQSQLGAQQQQYQQNLDTAAYQNYLNQMQMPYQQLSFLSSLMNAMPTSGSTTSIYSNPSPISMAAGLGTAATGVANLGKLAGAKKGGEIKEKPMRQGGLAVLAVSKLK